MRIVWVVGLVALLAGGCGGRMEAGSGSAPAPAAAHAVSGVYVRHVAKRPHGGSPAAGVRIALYREQVLAGPLLANTPKPVAVTRTDAQGRFSFPDVGRQRWFVRPLDEHAYAAGRWARPGKPVRLSGCTDCAQPL